MNTPATTSKSTALNVWGYAMAKQHLVNSCALDV